MTMAVIDDNGSSGIARWGDWLLEKHEALDPSHVWAPLWWGTMETQTTDDLDEAVKHLAYCMKLNRGFLTRQYRIRNIKTGEIIPGDIL